MLFLPSRKESRPLALVVGEVERVQQPVMSRKKSSILMTVTRRVISVRAKLNPTRRPKEERTEIRESLVKPSGEQNPSMMRMRGRKQRMLKMNTRWRR